MNKILILLSAVLMFTVPSAFATYYDTDYNPIATATFSDAQYDYLLVIDKNGFRSVNYEFFTASVSGNENHDVKKHIVEFYDSENNLLTRDFYAHSNRGAYTISSCESCSGYNTPAFATDGIYYVHLYPQDATVIEPAIFEVTLTSGKGHSVIDPRYTHDEFRDRLHRHLLDEIYDDVAEHDKLFEGLSTDAIDEVRADVLDIDQKVESARAVIDRVIDFSEGLPEGIDTSELVFAIHQELQTLEDLTSQYRNDYHKLEAKYNEELSILKAEIQELRNQIEE